MRPPPRSNDLPLLDAIGLDLQRRPDAPLHRQLYARLVQAITLGAIKPGEKLPSTRHFAHTLGVSRNTIMLAFEQLTAEGFLEGQTGSGTYVSREPPAEAGGQPAMPRINPAIQAAGSLDRSIAGVCGFSDVPSTLRHMRRPVPFRSNFPAVDAFPVQLWAKLAADIYRKLDGDGCGELLGEGDPQGYAPLRRAIVEHVAFSRGIECTAENVVIFAGAQHAVDLACRILLLPGDEAWCEDPGYDGIYASVTAAGAVAVPVPVDRSGLDVARAIARAPSARLAYVSPSKQFPLGMALSLERRRALLEWAGRADAWILEDDYDTEFRYSGRPLPALYALDRGSRVIYLGTFSKTLFPALRLGFAIVPTALVETFVGARAVVGRYSPMLEQAMVARFMSEGHFASHVRKMRKLYTQRQAHLLGALANRLRDWLTAEPTDTGMEVVARLAPGLSAREVSRVALAAGLEIIPLSALARDSEVDDLITLGFTAFTPAQMDDGVERLRVAVMARFPLCRATV